MWTDEDIQSYTRRLIDKFPYETPSAVALKSFYAGNRNKFTETRAIAEKEIQVYKQKKAKS